MKLPAAGSVIFTLLALSVCAGCTNQAASSATPQPTSTADTVSVEIFTLAETSTPFAPQTPMPTPRATDPVDNAVLSAPSAANAARMLRMGEDSDSVAYWDTAQPDASTYFRLRKAIRAMLSCTVGNGIIPVGREGIQFQPDPEIPLMAQDEKLQKGVDYNTRGSVYSNSPLTSVTA